MKTNLLTLWSALEVMGIHEDEPIYISLKDFEAELRGVAFDVEVWDPIAKVCGEKPIIIKVVKLKEVLGK